MAGTATPATTLLTRRGIAFSVHTYRHDRQATSFGTEAVDELGPRLGIDAAQVFKTLVIRAPDASLMVAVVPVPSTLSLKAAAAAVGVGKVVMADRAEAERSTGYVFGGISPVGQRKTLRTVIDSSALTWHRVLCSGGRRGLELELAPADLVSITDAVVADIRARRGE